MKRAFTFVVPGDILTRTGGYEYDRRMIQGLRDRGWDVTVCQLRDGFPHPGRAARTQAAIALAMIPDESVVVIDGLALGALPDEVSAHTGRLRLIALIHHPLALETGLSEDAAERLFKSEQRALASVRRVIVTSQATVEALKPYSVRRAEIAVVVPGTDRASLSKGSEGATHLLCVASIVPRKGHDLLIGALTHLRHLPWHLVCGGSLDRDPDWSEMIQAQVRDEGLAGRVDFVGELTDDALSYQYDRADVFVLATRYEGYGMVVGEALARGLPVVATNTGGIAELLTDNAGLIVPTDDEAALGAALEEVIGNDERRQALAAGARRRRETLPTWTDAATALENVLVKVAG